MRGRIRILRIDVCDYQKITLCSLYDNRTDVSGQATDVHIRYQRNGWKEVSFVIPSTCEGEYGPEKNYRLDFLIAEYKLRVVTNQGEDWYKITGESVRHEAFSKNYTITAPHISQILKNRGTDLEFSDANGNNVGTAAELAETVLKDTGWKLGKVAAFYEDDGKTIKKRSLNGGPKSNAFAFIENICELFEAKPVYNGDETVDILPMNPFSKLQPGEIPEAVYPGAAENEKYLQNAEVIELHYDKEIKNLERNRNTDNIATRLYAYGAYGNAIDKYCSVQTATHEERRYTVPDSGGPEFLIRDLLDAKRYFMADGAEPGDMLIWSMLDMNSRTYVWNDTRKVAYEVYNAPVTGSYTALEGEAEQVVNYFPYLSDYTYYRKVGLLTDEMLQGVAVFQRNMPEYYQNVIDAQAEANALSEQLSQIGVPKSGYLKLDVESCEQRDDGSVVTLRWSDEHPDGVIYRSDYLLSERNWFRWDVAQALKANGDPISSTASVLYILKDTNPIQWTAAYLKDIDGRQHTDVNGKTVKDGYDYQLSEGEKPKVLTLWSSVNIEPTDSVYLFGTNSISGKLGSKFSQDEAAVRSLESQLQIATHKHPTLFVDSDEALPEITFNSYGWCYQYDSHDYDTPGTLYFSWPARNDTGWKNTYIQDDEPPVENGAYFYNTRSRVLFHGEGGEWVKLESVEETEVAQAFGLAFSTCRKRDQLYKGLYDNYYYETASDLAPGNYAIPTAFGYYWLFTTDQSVNAGQSLRLDTTYRYVYQDDNIEHIVTPHSYPISLLVQPEENELESARFTEGSIYVNEDGKNGTDMATDRFERSNYIAVWPNETYDYKLPAQSLIVMYDANRNYLGYYTAEDGEGEFTATANAAYDDVLDPDSYVQFKKVSYIRVVRPKSDGAESGSISLKNYENVCFYDDLKYTILSPITHDEGEPEGINMLLRQFRDKTDELHMEKIPAVQAAQKVLTDENAAQLELLGDIIKDGWWQDDSYVKGDEQRMYNDALDNIEKLAQPETEYTFDFLDLYGSQDLCDEELAHIEWPDILITDAAHLIDPELDVDQWAYIDEINKCFDQPWKTTITVNTQLTLMAQHEFNDVLSRIAEVTSTTKAKQTVYSRAENINTDGTVPAENVSGEIDTTSVQLTGNGFKTDKNGNIILESGDGMAAIRFSGSGIAIANEKNADGDWQWRVIGDGFGLNGDSITSGTINGKLVKANSIRANSLMADVGNELDIGSNKALNLFATIDGAKPSGALKTTDAMIEIKAGDEEGNKAAINVLSGGEINMEAGADMNLRGGEINMESGANMNLRGGNINLDADSEMNINAGSQMNISSGGSLKIESDGTFEVHSDNFTVDKSGIVTVKGKIESDSGLIGGWHVDDQHIGNAEKVNDSSVGLVPPAADTDTVFWAGNTDQRNAPFQVDASGNMTASSGTVGGWYIGTKHLGNNPDLGNSSVGLYSGAEAANDVVIWAGSTTREDAPFKVKTSGEVVVSDINIIGGKVSAIEGDSQKLTNASIKASRIETSEIAGSSISGGNIQRTPITNGPIENETVKPVFSVTEDGDVAITKGKINFEKMQVEDTGSLTAADVDLSGEYRTRCVPQDSANLVNAVALSQQAGQLGTQQSKFDKLNPIKYEQDEKTRYGFIFEDVEELYPDLTRQSDNSVTYIDFIAILIREVQALRKRVAALEGS